MTFDIQWGGLGKIISGGQTGADQGGLLAAYKHDVKTGGTAPECYLTSIGYNPLLQILGLDAKGDYASRTRANILNSDGTVIIAHDLRSAGSILTRRRCIAEGKPCLEIDISMLVRTAQAGKSPENEERALHSILGHGEALHRFILEKQLQVLNVAGNREIPSDGTTHGTLIVTSAAEWIVSVALDLLDMDGKLIRSADFEK